MLVPLELSAAFDKIEHNILLENAVGIKCITVQWFTSYVPNLFMLMESLHTKINYGVTMDYVLVMILFTL